MVRTPGFGGDADAFGAVAVGGDRQLLAGGQIDDLAQGPQVELGIYRVAAPGHSPAGGHHLDEIHAVVQLPP